MKILDIFINKNCNLKCSYCTVSLDNKTINFSELKSYDYSSYNVINILGGEPLMHPEIIEILEFYNKFKDKTIILYTNGTYINKLKNLDLTNINVLCTFHILKEKIMIPIYNEIKLLNIKKIRYQVIISKPETIDILSNLDLDLEMCKQILIGYDIFQDINDKIIFDLNIKLRKFNTDAIRLLFTNNNFIEGTQIWEKDEYYYDPVKLGNYCALKYHFEW